MPQYSISDLERYSGIKAHTIRIWEQRYGILKPKRTSGNTRFYSDDELRKLLNISGLIRSDRKISEISKLADKEINEMMESDLRSSVSPDIIADHFISQMIMAGLKYDAAAFEKAFSASFIKLGIQDTYTKVLYPLLKKIGVMWRKSDISPAREHFLSHLVRQKIFSVIDALPPPAGSRDKWILFLPEDEEHEIGLLYAYYILRSMDMNVIYLGSRVPLDSLKDAVSETGAQNLLFFSVAFNSADHLQKYVKTLTHHFKKQKIYVSCNSEMLDKIKFTGNSNPLRSPDDLKEIYLTS